MRLRQSWMSLNVWFRSTLVAAALVACFIVLCLVVSAYPVAYLVLGGIVGAFVLVWFSRVVFFTDE